MLLHSLFLLGSKRSWLILPHLGSGAVQSLVTSAEIIMSKTAGQSPDEGVKSNNVDSYQRPAYRLDLAVGGICDVGTIKRPSSNRAVGLRVDMDALPIGGFSEIKKPVV